MTPPPTFTEINNSRPRSLQMTQISRLHSTRPAKTNLKTIATTFGIFIATVVITYAASSLIPTYAPGQNPPSLDQAPLLYRMAGQTDPDNFDHANDSLKAIGEKLDEIKTVSEAIQANSSKSSAVFVANGQELPADKNTCIGEWWNGSSGTFWHMTYHIRSGDTWNVTGGYTASNVTTCYNNQAAGCICF